MSKAPAFQFYAQDFLTGTMYLTNEEIGMYIKMLAKQWTDGKIPKKRLGFLVGSNWEDLSEELQSKFKESGDFLLNTRLEEEREKKERFLQKQSKNGSKGGRPPKNDKPKVNPNKSQKKPLEEEDEIEVEKEDRKGNKKNEIVKSETDFDQVEETLDRCLEYFPKHLHPDESVRDKWLDTIEKLNRIDNVPFENIIEIVKKTRENDFWSKNFLSLTKLRKKNKDDVMYIVVFNEQIKGNGKAKSNNQDSNYSSEYLRKKAESLTGIQS